MSTATRNRQTNFRLNEALVNRLKIAAKKENRSLSNYVECILLEAVSREPNQETSDAIREAREGKSAGTLDMTSFDAFMKSVNEIE